MLVRSAGCMIDAANHEIDDEKTGQQGQRIPWDDAQQSADKAGSHDEWYGSQTHGFQLCVSHYVTSLYIRVCFLSCSQDGNAEREHFRCSLGDAELLKRANVE